MISQFYRIVCSFDEDVIAYLRYSHKIAEYAVLAERNAFVLNICEQFGLTVTDEELQTAGDAFRLEHKLLGVSETLAWLQQQRITVDDWSRGTRLELLTKKLKEYLFGDAVDSHYLSNFKDYQRVALSQILVSDLTEAKKVTYAIQESNESFCALALEYSKGKQSKQNGGFVRRSLFIRINARDCTSDRSSKRRRGNWANTYKTGLSHSQN
jgi:parvulin-like peptidyl-prolyl isomerase